MHRKELNERSPLRVLEQSIHGGLGRGNLGVMVARTGVGKTAFLVGVALDDLMRGQKVLHISLQHPVEKIRTYYDDIFGDLAHTRELEDVWKVRTEMERNRRIHHFRHGAFSVDKLRDTLGFMRAHGDFSPSTILIDGYDFAAASAGDMGSLREIARSIEAELWMSAVTHRDSEIDDTGVPEPVAHLGSSVDVILRMAHDGDNVHVSLLKDHDNPNVSDLKLALDPTTMLLIKE